MKIDKTITKGKYFDLLTNPLNLFPNEMYMEMGLNG